MTRLALALAFLLPSALNAQLQILALTPEGPQPMERSYDLGRTAVGDPLRLDVRLHNQGTAAVTVQSVRIAGAGFALIGAPSSSLVLPAGQMTEFQVRFLPTGSGSYSANLTVNERAIILRASGMGAPSVSYETDGVRRQVSAGQTIDCGRTERNLSVRRPLLFANATTETLPLPRPVVAGTGFALESATLPEQLEPGQTVRATLVFTPTKAGTHQGTLTLDNRTFILSGVGTDPTPPRPRLEVSQANPSSAQQVRVKVLLAEAAKSDGTGRLRVEFRPTRQNLADESIQFLANSSRTVDFTVKTGATQASFGTAADVALQTGTSAGVFSLTVEYGGYTESSVFTVGATSPVVDEVRALRSANGVDISLSGYDNTASATQLAFTFLDRQGAAINAQPILADVALPFRAHFDASRLGGTFVVRAAFPITGDLSLLGGVEVTITNPQGSTKKRADVQ